MNTVSILEQLQGVAADALSDDPMFDGTLSASGVAVPIVSEVKGSIETQIDTAMGSVGICALVTTPTFEFFNEKLYELSGYADLLVDILENPPVNQSNGTQIPAIRLAARTLSVLHRFPTGLVTGPTNLIPSFIGIKKPIVLGTMTPLVSYTVSFQAHVLLP